MTFNKLIFALIKTGKMFDLSRRELAELTGYGASTVSDWHKEASRVSLRHFIDWANALGYEVTLIRREDDPITNVRTRK